MGGRIELTGQGLTPAAIEAAAGRQGGDAGILREFSDISQANLQPFLDVANRQLPGLEAAATPQGFFGDAEALRPIVEQIGAPIVEDRLRDLSSALGQQGSTRSGFAALSAAQVQEDVDLSLLLQLQSMLQGRRGAVAGFGANTGESLARLGQSSAGNLASAQSQGFLNSAQADVADTQNLINLASLATDFFSTED